MGCAVPQGERSLHYRPLFVATSAVFVSCLVLGGGTRQGFLTDAIVQYASIPLFLCAVWQLVWPQEPDSAMPPQQVRNLLIACALIALLPMVQLVPLPPAIWTALPGRELLVGTFATLDRALPWHPISVSPQATLGSFLSLIPAFAIFLATCCLSFVERRHMSILMLGAAVLAVFLGLLQVVQGPDSALRFFQNTNVDDAVGFFANRNHQSALLYCATVISAAWVIALLESITTDEQREGMAPTRMIAILLAITGIIIFAATQVFTRSRAGVALTMIAFGGALLIGARRNKSADQTSKLRWIAVGCTIAVVLMAQIALYRVAERFTPDQLADSRAAYARTTFQAARDFLPFGSGVGTFPSVYAAYERREDLVADTYANRAHNDYLEFFLEGGVFGILLVVPLAGLLLIKAARCWRAADGQIADIDVTLQRAGSLVILLLLLHSLVDYPLRTTALLSLFSFAAALVVSGRAVRTASRLDTIAHHEPSTLQGQAARPRSPRKSSVTRMNSIPKNPQPSATPTSRQDTPQTDQTPSATAGDRWGKAVEWPDAWRDAPVTPHPSTQAKSGATGTVASPTAWERPKKPSAGS